MTSEPQPAETSQQARWSNRPTYGIIPRPSPGGRRKIVQQLSFVFSVRPGPGFVISVRPFWNTDVPVVIRLWNEQRAETGLRTPLSSASLEVAILNRTFFEPDQLLIASTDGQCRGFVHWLISAEDASEAVVANLAVPSGQLRDEIAGALLQAAIDAARRAGASRLLIGQAPEHWTGYAGIAVRGIDGGVAESDTTTQGWAKQAGFASQRVLLNYSLDMATYRPAYDRELITLRRVATVARRMDLPEMPFRVASAMSHLQLNRFVAERRGGEKIAEADVMTGDPEMLVVTGSSALLTRWAAIPPAPHGSSPATRFVLASAMLELAADRVTHVQATIDETDRQSKELLQRTGFALDHRGILFARSI